MTPEPAPGSTEALLEQLLDEWVEAREQGRSDVEGALLERAGEHAGELRDRMDVLRDLVALGSALEQAREPRAAVDPTELGRFTDLVPLGEGGVSRVYVGRDPKLGRTVAIKVLDPRHTDLEQTQRWMDSEGRALASVEHPAIVRLFEVDQHEGLGFAVMELVRGVSLHQVVQQLRAWRDAGESPGGAEEHDAPGPAGGEDSDPGASEDLLRAARALAPLPARVAFVAQLAGALDACHRRGVVHRDVKPGNVLVQRDGAPKLIDFGLAHLEDSDSLGMTQRLVGTPGYLAPEQVDGLRTGSDPRSDQFSLGVVLYELLTLQNPFLQETRAATLTAISSAAPPDPRSLVPSLPRDLALITLHALERDPAQRYPDLAAMEADLRAFLEYRATSVSSGHLWHETRRWVRRNRRRVLAASLAVVLILGTVISLSLSAALGERDGVLERTRRLERALESAQGSDAHVTIAEELPLLLAEVSQYSGRSVWRRVLGDVRGRFDALTRDFAESVLEQAGEEYDQARSEPLSNIRDSAMQHTYRRWDRAVSQALMLQPEFPGLRELSGFGRVDLPEGARIAKLRSFHAVVNARPVEAESMPGPGRYRVKAELAGTPCEWEFTLASWDPLVVVDARVDLPAFQRVRASLATFEGRVLEWSDGLNPLNVYVPAFEIGREPVTWELAAEVLGLEHVLRLQAGPNEARAPELRDPGEPARLSLPDATRLASSLGLRLPSVVELLVALDSGRVGEGLSEDLLSGTYSELESTFLLVSGAGLESVRANEVSLVETARALDSRDTLVALPRYERVHPFGLAFLCSSGDSRWPENPLRD